MRRRPSRSTDRRVPRASLTVAPIRNSRLVDVKFRSPDPALATQRRQRAGEELHRADPRVQVPGVARKPTTGSASGWPSSASRSRPPKPSSRRYREQNDAISLEDRENIVVQKLADLNAAVTKRQDRADPEGGAVQPAAQPCENNPAALDTFPAILDQHLHPAAEGRAGAAPAAARAAVGEVRRQAPRHHQGRVGDPERRS